MKFKLGYKSYFTHLGCSDIASLLLRGCSEKGQETHILNLGGDNSYTAWIIDETVDIPSHYHFECEFHTWMWVYDDFERMGKFEGDKIRVYRAGMMGILIQIINPRNWSYIEM